MQTVIAPASNLAGAILLHASVLIQALSVFICTTNVEDVEGHLPFLAGIFLIAYHEAVRVDSGLGSGTSHRIPGLCQPWADRRNPFGVDLAELEA